MVIKNDCLKDNFKSMFRFSGFSKPIIEGSFVEGVVVSKQKHVMTLYTGLKTTTQFLDKELKSLTEKNQEISNPIGKKTQLYLHNIENPDGEAVFNLHMYHQHVKALIAWDRVHKLKFVKGIVLNTVNGGFSVGIGGVVAFLPKSRAKLPNINKKEYISHLMHNYHLYKIIKVNYDRRNIIVSLVNNVIKKS
uniref:Ribosomal protein S1 n=1 Tax=Reclinomonas americana TaxID=48483 RepID=O21261_RECAM|nr:ribosomal protein S1 [Reclinomonas americana]AAD11888.1 ribosomal protein S1 [Reclinomonas americana]